MKKALLLLSILMFSCSSDSQNPAPVPVQQNNPDPENPDPENPTTFRYLALGDSYTYGQNVCETCRFPEQLKSRLADAGKNVNISMYAVTGWTTTDLLSAVGAVNFASDFSLATLLIGVNNQYQHKPFSLYETEFPALVNKAIAATGGDKNKVIVVSIPDYAYTPFGQGSSNPGQISTQLDQYNDFARQYCQQRAITFVDITDITREGLNEPQLVANDGLHPSDEAYRRFVLRLLPKALEKLP